MGCVAETMASNRRTKDCRMPENIGISTDRNRATGKEIKKVFLLLNKTYWKHPSNTEWNTVLPKAVQVDEKQII